MVHGHHWSNIWPKPIESFSGRKITWLTVKANAFEALVHVQTLVVTLIEQSQHLSSVTLSNISRSSKVVVPKFKTYQIQNIPFYSHTIFFLVRKYHHIWHTKHLCQQNKSAVAMLPCVICSFEALSEKHLRMHMQNEHDDSVITCEKCNKSCKGGRKFKTHMNSHREVNCKDCGKKIP